jgi:hypothetical protein
MALNSQEDYSKNGMQTRVWGPAGWIFLHCIAQNYPKEPTEQQQEDYLSFFRITGSVLPCRYCRESYQQFISEPDTLLDKAVVKNRQTITKWLYKIHNKINKKLGINDPITFAQVTEKYESFRSKCKVTTLKPIKGCTGAAKDGTARKKCVPVIIEVDENGNQLNNFGKKESKQSKSGRTSRKIRLVSIKKSKASGKKYTATFETNGRTKQIHFGAAGMSDYTKHKDRARRQRYITRHKKDLGTGNPARAGYLSMFILWNKTSVSAGIADYRRRLGVYNSTGRFPTNIS